MDGRFCINDMMRLLIQALIWSFFGKPDTVTFIWQILLMICWSADCTLLSSAMTVA